MTKFVVIRCDLEFWIVYTDGRPDVGPWLTYKAATEWATMTV